MFISYFVERPKTPGMGPKQLVLLTKRKNNWSLNNEYSALEFVQEAMYLPVATYKLQKLDQDGKLMDNGRKKILRIDRCL